MTTRLLTMNCHEAWIHQLGYLGMDLDIIDGLPGRYTSSWDTHVRPIPPRARLLSLEDVVREKRRYHCIVCHNVQDLLDTKELDAPRILVVHTTLQAKAGKQAIPPGFPQQVKTYVDALGGHIVVVSEMKGATWGFTEDVVPFAVDVDLYPPWTGEVAAGIRVSNQVTQKRAVLLWDFHEAAFRDVPVKLVGHNPDFPGVSPSASWDDLKDQLSRHRFYVHTAQHGLEDGYNMATLEAMAAGLPVLGNKHPTSPIEHGVDGFLSDDPIELSGYARQLLEDRALAGRMGEGARKKARERFSMQVFAEKFGRSIETARRRYETRPRIPKRKR